MNSATSFMNLPSSQKSVRAFRETGPRSENECAKHRIFFSQEKGSLENRLVYDKHAPPKLLGVLQAWVNVPVCFSLAGEQVKYAFGTVVSCDHCSVPVSH